MKKLISIDLYKNIALKIRAKISVILKHLSLTEKIVFYTLVVIFVFSTVSLLNQANQIFMSTIPTNGGYLNEGIVGSPHFINPVLATTDLDRDMVSLVYSGLLKFTPEGDLIPDLAESYSVSDDKTTYTFNIRSDATFQDGVSVTSDDVEFTIEKTLDPAIKSPKMANWKNIKVTKINDRQIEFSLPQVYPSFLSNLTLGILPKHLWKNLNSDEFPLSFFNIQPIGSGPYKINSMIRTPSGLISYYDLLAYDNYTLGTPYISNLYIHFYQNEKKLAEALKSGEVESAGGLSPQSLETVSKDKNKTTNLIPLTHIFGFFLNQSQNHLFTQPEIRQTLNDSLDRDRIVKEALFGYGKKLTSPIPQDLLPINYLTDQDESTSTPDFEKIKQTLASAGWKLNKDNVLEKKVKKETFQFAFSIFTSNQSELSTAAQIAKESWEKIGAQVTIKLYETGDLQNNIIRPRKFDVLLFGEVIGRDLDFYGYWHSSQRLGSGLNLSSYANAKVDKILEDARKIDDKDKRAQKYLEFEKEILKDLPAIFSHSHEFAYVLPNKVQDFHINTMTTPSERFLGVSKWYVETDRVWKFLVK